MSPISL